MECTALQAMCDFRGVELYTFFTSGDLLDAPEWDTRRKKGLRFVRQPLTFAVYSVVFV